MEPYLDLLCQHMVSRAKFEAFQTAAVFGYCINGGSFSKVRVGFAYEFAEAC
jgi:hypothetical protein